MLIFVHVGAVIGFLETEYTALESTGYVTLVFGLRSGGVQQPVNVLLSLTNGSALGEQMLSNSIIWTLSLEVRVTLDCNNQTRMFKQLWEFACMDMVPSVHA